MIKAGKAGLGFCVCHDTIVPQGVRPVEGNLRGTAAKSG